MRSGSVTTGREPFEHVAEVADQDPRLRADVDPRRVETLHLQAAVTVLCEQREQPVVGVLADAPLVRGLVARRVVEDPEQHGGIGGQVLGEPGGREAEAERDAAHDRVGDESHRGEPLEDERAEFGRVGRELVRTVEWCRRLHPMMSARMFESEVDAFLAVRHAGGELAPDREPAAPRCTGVGHGDLGLARLRASEECMRRRLEPVLQVRADAVPRDGEESDMTARLIDRRRGLGDRSRPCVVGEKRCDVDDRNVWCGAHELVAYDSATGA